MLNLLGAAGWLRSALRCVPLMLAGLWVWSRGWFLTAISLGASSAGYWFAMTGDRVLAGGW